MGCCGNGEYLDDAQWIGSKEKGATGSINYFSHLIRPIRLESPNKFVFSQDPLVKDQTKMVASNLSKASGVIGLTSCVTATANTVVNIVGGEKEYVVATDQSFTVTAAGGLVWELPRLPPRTPNSPVSRVSGNQFSLGVCGGIVNVGNHSGSVYLMTAGVKDKLADLIFEAKCNCCLTVRLPAAVSSLATFKKGRAVPDTCGLQEYCYEIINSANGAATSVIKGKVLL